MTEKYGFVYLWRDKKHNRYYVGCHWGTVDDGYLCSSRWMRKSLKRRPADFKRRILKTNLTREGMYEEEQRYFDMIKREEIKPNTETPKYYNLNLKSIKPWHAFNEQVATVGEKISAQKKGKPITFKDPSERGRKISEGKKRTFEKKQEELGYKVAPETIQKRLNSMGDFKHSEETKQVMSQKRTEYLEAHPMPKKERPKTMTKDEQGKLCSKQLKSRWSDPVWAANQRKSLSEGAKKRPPRSEESKMKARLAQLGKPKNRTLVMNK